MLSCVLPYLMQQSYELVLILFPFYNKDSEAEEVAMTCPTVEPAGCGARAQPRGSGYTSLRTEWYENKLILGREIYFKDV